MRSDRRGSRHHHSDWQMATLAAAAGFAMVTVLSGGTASAANANGPVPNTAAGFQELLDRGDLIFNHYDGRRSSATFKAVYTVETATAATNDGGDCTKSSKTVTIEENGSDNLTYFPECAEAIATASNLYLCEWGKAVQCYSKKGNYFSNPFLSWEEQNLSPSSVLSTIESGSGESPQGTYSHTTVAGQPSECVTATYFRLCVTDVGLLALLELTGSAASAAGGAPLAMTFYRPSAPDSDFRPPVTASTKAGAAARGRA